MSQLGDRTTRSIFKLAALLCLLAPICATAQATAKDVDYEEKPLVVLVFDQNCKAWCAKVKPIMGELQQEYGDKVLFAQLDATQSVLPEAKKQAKQLGILSFFSDFEDYVPVVGFFSAHRKLIKELTGPKSKDEYKLSIDKAMSVK
jgi:thiol-disulfide isomerase/thioredoxin